MIKLGFIVAFLSMACMSWADIVLWRINQTGIFPEVTPVTEWATGEAAKHIRWQTKTSSWSNASPILIGDKLYFHAEPNKLVCVNAIDGAMVWEKVTNFAEFLSDDDKAKSVSNIDIIKEKRAAIQVIRDDIAKKTKEAKAAGKKVSWRTYRKDHRKISKIEGEIRALDVMSLPSAHNDNGYTSHQPITDGTLIYTVYGSGTVAAHDLNGDRKWGRFFSKPSHKWGHSNTPVIAGGLLVVYFEGKLYGLDLATGGTKWSIGTKMIWGSPIVTQVEGQDVIITPQGKAIIAQTGKSVWGTMGHLEYASPVIQDGVVYFIQDKASAWRLPSKLSGASEKLWDAKIQGSRHYASPVIYDGLVHTISREEIITVLDAQTGKKIYQHKLGLNKGVNSAYSSLVLAGGNLYAGMNDGPVLVFKPGRTFEQVAVNNIGKMRSTPLFHKDVIYLRTLNHITAIGK